MAHSMTELFDDHGCRSSEEPSGAALNYRLPNA